MLEESEGFRAKAAPLTTSDLESSGSPSNLIKLGGKDSL